MAQTGLIVCPTEAEGGRGCSSLYGEIRRQFVGRFAGIGRKQFVTIDMRTKLMIPGGHSLRQLFACCIISIKSGTFR